jgi:NDP-sugar pyrophosphorylase family protein
MKKPTLVVLAAGMGSRYGGLKQMDVFTPEGDSLIDFFIYDALRAGFGKFVFVIKKNFEKEFREIFDKKLKCRAEVAYVYQEPDTVPEAYVNPERTNWGTGHAFLKVKDAIEENFAIINADNFNGKEDFVVMAKASMESNKESYDFCTMAYLPKNTVSDHGFVSRGECKVSSDCYLVDVTERTHIERINGFLMNKDDDGNIKPIDKDAIVSMNFWGFTPKCFEFGSELFINFLEANKGNLKAEFYLPTIVNEILNLGKAKVEVLKSKAKWFGVTYKEGKEIVETAIKKIERTRCFPQKTLVI